MTTYAHKRTRKEAVGFHWRSFDGLYYLIGATVFYLLVAWHYHG